MFTENVEVNILCVSPSYVYADKGPSFERLEVACGWCWSCQKNRINDLVGRCLCEAATSDWTRTLTLTYDDRRCSPEQTRVIHKEDFQLFKKRLQHIFKTRYLVAGEYGSKKGRVHFHCVLFGKGEPPSWDLNKRIHLDRDPLLWEWGHVWVDDAVSERDFRYCAKYLLKGAKRKRTRFENKYNKEWISYSRIPIMGLDYVLEYAQRYVDERVFPSSFKYRPPMCSDNREYQFIGETRYVMLDAIYSAWPEALDIKKNETMEKAQRRYLKERQKRQWQALSGAAQGVEIEKSLTLEETLSPIRIFKAGIQLYQEMEDHGTRKIGTFFEAKPDRRDYFNAVYGRDLATYPPTYAETPRYFPA